MLSGISIRKETDSRISASVAGFCVFVLRAAGGGRFAASGRDSWRGLFLFEPVVLLSAGWGCELTISCVLSSFSPSSGFANISHPTPKSSSSSRSSIARRKAIFFGLSTILLSFSSANINFRILAYSLLFARCRASASSSESERSKSAPPLRRRPPLLMSLWSLDIACSSAIRSFSLESMSAEILDNHMTRMMYA